MIDAEQELLNQVADIFQKFRDFCLFIHILPEKTFLGKEFFFIQLPVLEERENQYTGEITKEVVYREHVIYDYKKYTLEEFQILWDTETNKRETCLT